MKEQPVPAIAIAATTTTATTTTHLRPVPDPPEGLERLFRDHHDLVFRTAYRITGSLSDAEDVLQTIFLRLVRREEQHDLAPSPAGYLHRAAINAALDLVRSRTKCKFVPLDDVAPNLIGDSGHNPETQHAERELRQLIQQAVASLGSRAAEIFVLRYFEGHDNREIAGLLGTSQMVVAVVLHRARGQVRKVIGEFLEKHYEAK